MDLVSDEPLIHGEGTGESHWLSSTCLTGLAPIVLDQLVPAGSRLMVVAPHPDDEVLACGGLLFSHLLAGGRAEVVVVTDGEASHAGEPDWLADDWAAVRRRESALGLRSLGAHDLKVHRLGLPDGGVTAARATLQRWLQPLLLSSDALVSTWRHDGHPDHEATAEACREAGARAGCRFIEAPVWMWHWSHPGDPRVPWHRLHALALTQAACDAKQQALLAHQSQLQPKASGQPPILGNAIVQRARRSHEYFFI